MPNPRDVLYRKMAGRGGWAQLDLADALLSFQLKCSSNIDSIHYLGLTNSFDQVPRNIHTLPSIIVNFLLNSLNAPITFVVCATNQS